ncbi:hypothetical protein SAMN04488003_10688 [Loktanella fryxellensis]|uniref:Uncharacterized protein n=1 Tax=Loktanella fryxellensis TaxID=245187 RepID=A0A1H8C761_9RHOB|nr:hypothetical protein [Loktanella fryxellensis]SEM90913.1 hypothetical protein SAMN04488003_10688 [Loktanella fryxellensis]
MTIKGGLAGGTALLAGWIGVLALVMVVSDAAPGALVLFPPHDLLAGLPRDVAVAGIGRHWISVTAQGGDLTAALYDAGAWIVLPAGLQGCLPTG